MPTTFIEYKDDKGFNIAEDFMQLTIYYIHEELKKPQYIFVNKNIFEMGHEGIIDGVASSYLTLPWNKILINSSEEQTMIQILQEVKASIQNKGVYISVAELQSIPTKDKDLKRLFSRKPFPTSELIRIIDALIKMLQGTWEYTNYNMDINYQY
ncbi:hypothetical protein [Pedobacter sp. GR22-10]|uniref:hypothetical protein n=1 Tax=Pedobacter sp. GR22-10 TaxID=2994472 RepID=UPI002245A65A|nr:hypothetical protein [Pedobacter sp. GR22-10]MCX2431030.1 hypothetical protein [Pedobacter sp. GR22-10]